MILIKLAENEISFDENDWFHDNLSNEEQLRIAQLGSKDEKEKLSKNLNITLDAQQLLAKDHCVKVRFGLLKNPNISQSLRYKLLVQKKELNEMIFKFITLFKKKHGRNPTGDEINEFFTV